MNPKKEKVEVKIIDQQKIASDIYEMWVEHQQMAQEALAGQFVALYCRDGSRLLPRPISICEIDREKGYLRFVYRVVGKGTKEFSKLIFGDTIEIMGPLGNGFKVNHHQVSVLVGGGIGIPPLLELAKQLEGEKHIFLGYRDDTFLINEFKKYGHVYVATEDGSEGEQGNVMTLLNQFELKMNEIYACGPKPMLVALKDYVMKNKIIAQFSLEEKMACGIGACLGCVCETKEPTKKNKRICKDGPVFLATEVDF